MTSYVISQQDRSTLLVVEDNELFMRKTSSTNVFLTTFDDVYGLIHNEEKIFAFVEINKVSNLFTLKNLNNQHFFCSRPLTSPSARSYFRANREFANEWESFNLKEIVLEKTEFYNSFINFLQRYKKPDEIKLFWWRGKNFTNFGDELNLYIVSHLTKKKVKRVEKVESSLIGIGSILDWFPKRNEPYEVWGAGTLAPCNLLDEDSYNVSLLRGPLTKSLLKQDLSIPYGDPGILSSIIWKAEADKKYDWGLIVHHTQERKLWVQNLLKNTPNSILISVKNEDMSELMGQISSCKNIASTSLHGLIVADSYCIPNIWLWDNNIHKGGQWKFFDYFAGINRFYVDNIDPLTITSLSDISLVTSEFKYFSQIEKIQERVIKAFPLK